MRSQTIANEKISPFYLKLKRRLRSNGYYLHLTSMPSVRQFNHRHLNQEILVNQLAFFKKHFWCKFHYQGLRGWIPLKAFRKNYCRLKLPPLQLKYYKLDSAAACTLILCYYKRPASRVISLIHAHHLNANSSISQFFRVIVNQVGSFKNLSNKSVRRIRNQIRCQRPVIVWLNSYRVILLEGFNRRVFFYFDPLKKSENLITRKHFLKQWKRAGCRAYSC